MEHISSSTNSNTNSGVTKKKGQLRFFQQLTAAKTFIEKPIEKVEKKTEMNMPYLTSTTSDLDELDLGISLNSIAEVTSIDNDSTITLQQYNLVEPPIYPFAIHTNNKLQSSQDVTVATPFLLQTSISLKPTEEKVEHPFKSANTIDNNNYFFRSTVSTINKEGEIDDDMTTPVGIPFGTFNIPTNIPTPSVAISAISNISSSKNIVVPKTLTQDSSLSSLTSLNVNSIERKRSDSTDSISTVITLHSNIAISITEVHSVPMSNIFVAPRSINTKGKNTKTVFNF